MDPNLVLRCSLKKIKIGMCHFLGYQSGIDKIKPKIKNQRNDENGAKSKEANFSSEIFLSISELLLISKKIILNSLIISFRGKQGKTATSGSKLQGLTVGSSNAQSKGQLILANLPHRAGAPRQKVCLPATKVVCPHFLRFFCAWPPPPNPPIYASTPNFARNFALEGWKVWSTSLTLNIRTDPSLNTPPSPRIDNPGMTGKNRTLCMQHNITQLYAAILIFLMHSNYAEVYAALCSLRCCLLCDYVDKY